MTAAAQGPPGKGSEGQWCWCQSYPADLVLAAAWFWGFVFDFVLGSCLQRCHVCLLACAACLQSAGMLRGVLLEVSRRCSS